jgi:hypothetical protein
MEIVYMKDIRDLNLKYIICAYFDISHSNLFIAEFVLPKIPYIHRHPRITRYFN